MSINTSSEEKNTINLFKHEKYRIMLNNFIKNEADIFDLKLLKDEEDKFTGFISFTVETLKLGISITFFNQYKEEIISQYFIKFLTELLIRENLDVFIQLVSQLSIDEINEFEDFLHKRFGIKINGVYTTFTFHSSFLINLLKEEYK